MADLLEQLADGAAPAGDTSYLTTPTGGATATAHATVNTLGSWVEVVAATTTDIDELTLEVVNGPGESAATRGMLLDIGIGASGSETVLVPQANVGSLILSSVQAADSVVTFPIFVPAGSRLAVRCQSVLTVDTIAVKLHGRRVGLYPRCRRCTTYGANAATSLGTSVVSGNAAWTATPVELTSGLTFPAKRLALTVGHSNAGMTNDVIHLRLLTGASGSEVVLPQGIFTIAENGSEEVVWKFLPHYLARLAAATRVSVQSWGGSAARTAGVCLHVFD